MGVGQLLGDDSSGAVRRGNLRRGVDGSRVPHHAGGKGRGGGVGIRGIIVLLLRQIQR